MARRKVNQNGVLTIQATVSDPGSKLNRNLPNAKNPRQGSQYLVNQLNKMLPSGGTLSVKVEETESTTATALISFSQAALTAGDKVTIGNQILTAVAGTANSALGQFSTDTSSVAVAESFIKAVNDYSALSRLVVGVTASAGTGSLESYYPGSQGNLLTLVKSSSNPAGITISSGPTFVGGCDPNQPGTVDFALSTLPANGSSLTLGRTTMTFVNSGVPTAYEIKSSGSVTATVASAIEQINANPELNGVLYASHPSTYPSGTFKVDCVATPHRVGMQLPVSGTGSTNITFSANTFGYMISSGSVIKPVLSSSTGLVGDRVFGLGTTKAVF